jgi:hypothetical protein
MRRWLTALVLLLVLPVAPAVRAEDEEEEEEEREPTVIEEYFVRVGSNAAAGLNGLVTAPADPVALTVDGDEVFGSPVGGRVLGFGAGSLQAIYRAVMGVSDIALAIVPAMPMLSPVPRYKLLPFEHPEE